MKTNLDKLVDSLGCGPDTCPLCRGPLTTTTRDAEAVVPGVRGLAWHECPSCGFRGDSVRLAAAARASTRQDALAALVSAGAVSCTARERESLVAHWAEQDAVDAHFAVCVERLRRAPERGGIRSGLSVSSLRQLPPDTGLNVTSDAPAAFGCVCRGRYLHVPLTLYRYRFDGSTTVVDAKLPSTGALEQRIRVSDGPVDVGVYLGDYRPGEIPDTVLATHDPRIAGLLYGACRAESARTPPVVGVAGFPLPARFAALSRVYLLDAPDAPLPLEFALRAWSTQTVYGLPADRQPDIRVATPQLPATDIRAENIRLLTSRTLGVPITEWLRRRLVALSDDVGAVAKAILRAGVPDAFRGALADLLGADAPRRLADTVRLPSSEPDDVLTLGNGRLVQNTRTGIYAAVRDARTGEVTRRSTLLNVGIRVLSRVVGPSGETAVCRVTHPDCDVSPVVVRIPARHWANVDRVAQDIRDAYADTGRVPYVAGYRASGYSLHDVFQLLGAVCPVQDALGALGMTPSGAVNLPAVEIVRGACLPQTRAGGLSDDVLAKYAALPLPDASMNGVGAGAGVDVLSDLLVRPASPRVAGLAAGLMHVLYCVTGRMFDASGSRRPPCHLLFVETEPGVWDDVLRDIAYFLSGSEHVPLVDYADPSGSLAAMAGLGTLPLVARLPSLERVASVLASSPVPVVGVADVLTALACSGRGRISFVLPNAEHARDFAHDDLGSGELARLRAAFVSAIAGLGVECPWRDVMPGAALSVDTPCLTVAGSLVGDGRAPLPGSPHDCLLRSVRARFNGVGMTGLATFFNVLHREFCEHAAGDGALFRLTIVQGAPPEAVAASFNARGEHVFVMDDAVVMSRQVVAVVNREQSFLFDAEQLSSEMRERGILLDDVPGRLGIDPRRVWAFPRQVWDEHVVRAVGFGGHATDKGE